MSSDTLASSLIHGFTNILCTRMTLRQLTLLRRSRINRFQDFKVGAKTNYDHGESECILLVDGQSKIENIAQVCQEYTFTPNTTIKRLLQIVETYAVGTIAAIVTGTKTSGMQYMLEIKDGNSQYDKATVSKFATMDLPRKILCFLPLNYKIIHFLS